MVRSLDEPFLVKPETGEYEVLCVLVANQKDGTTSDEIVAKTELSTSRAVETLGLLSKSEIVYQEDGVYYIGSEQAERLKRRLKSVDAAVQLFESTPDDAYAEEGWRDQVASINLKAEPETVGTAASRTAEEEAGVLIEEVEEEISSG